MFFIHFIAYQLHFQIKLEMVTVQQFSQVDYCFVQQREGNVTTMQVNITKTDY